MMAALTLETIPEETAAPAVAPAVAPATPARITSDAPKQTKPATEKKNLDALLLAKGWQNATAWPVKQRKRQKQRPQNKPQ